MKQFSKIQSLEISGLFNKKNLKWNLGNVNVLVGRNGSGKSTILNILRSLLKNDSDSLSLPLCDSAKIITNNFSSIEYSNAKELDLELIKKILTDIDQRSLTLKKENSTPNKKNDYQFDYKNNHNHKNKIKKFPINQGVDKSLRELETLKMLLQDMNFKKNKYLTSFEDKIIFKNISNNEIVSSVNVEFISTINMSANSLNEIKSSEGIKTTILDMEMKKELLRFKELLKTKSPIKNKFLSTLNKLFSESDITVEYYDAILLFTRKHDHRTLILSELSSGERQLIYILLKVANATDKPSILLMDEPEISLHLSWQEQLIESIQTINDNCQIIIVTHSPAMVMNGWMDCFIDIDDISELINV